MALWTWITVRTYIYVHLIFLRLGYKIPSPPVLNKRLGKKVIHYLIYLRIGDDPRIDKDGVMLPVAIPASMYLYLRVVYL